MGFGRLPMVLYLHRAAIWLHPVSACYLEVGDTVVGEKAQLSAQGLAVSAELACPVHYRHLSG
jgi:hypothetical protein